MTEPKYPHEYLTPFVWPLFGVGFGASLIYFSFEFQHWCIETFYYDIISNPIVFDMILLASGLICCIGIVSGMLGVVAGLDALYDGDEDKKKFLNNTATTPP
ncbi:MAG: hypothetical protein PHC39_04735 [Proteiniphilum sp.]|nr:hypothetical protein [Proteiniphilum sp.]